MAKQWCDWSDLMKGKPVQPEHPLSKPLTYTGPTLKKGEVPRKPTDEEIREVILKNAPKQPSDQELFGAGVVTEEQAKQAESEWHNRFNDFYNKVKKPVEKQSLNKSWGRGPIHKEKLTEEEERIRNIPVDPKLLSGD